MAIDRSDLSPFGILLKAFRTRRGFTQQQIAEQLGMRRNTIGRWERGDFLPGSKGMVLELARCLLLDNQETRQLLEASLLAPSPHWLVPLPRNPFFTGREEILKSLHIHLSTNEIVALTQAYALHGLGGIGKTQIALEYAYRHALEYSAVFWIGAETSENIIASLLHIADLLQLRERKDTDQQHVVAAVQRWLKAHTNWLLIWDNLEDLALLSRFLPPTQSGTVLITTRHQALGTLAWGIDLLPMEHEEGMLFLLRRAKVLEPEARSEQLQQLATQIPDYYTAATDLVSTMGGLPLALDQAGAYIEETQCGLPGYIGLFRTQRAALLQQRGGGSLDHPESVVTTFTLAITATAQRHPAVWDLLRICALLSDAVPEELFQQGAEYFGATLGTVSCNSLEWNRMIAAASAYSLLSRQPETQTLFMHRLVQAVLVDGMTKAERKRWNRRAIRALDAAFPEAQPDIEYTDWKQRERLLPHALLCLQRAGTVEESLVLASLAYKAAQYLRERGRYAQAEPLYQRVLRIREHLLGPKHTDVATSLYYLAEALREQGKYAQVEPLHQRALQIREQALSPDHPDVGSSLTGLALLYWQVGKDAQSEALFRRALHIWELTFGSEHPRVATSFYHQAEVSRNQGKYEQAKAFFQRALDLWKQTLGPDHPERAFAFTGLGYLFKLQGKNEQAKAFFQRALDLWERTLGPDHPYRAFPLTGLAELHVKQGKAAQAETLYQQAVDLWEQSQSADNLYITFPLAGLAALSANLGKDVQAEALFQRTLHILEQTLGPDHLGVAYSLLGLAKIYRKQGHYTEAEILFQRVLSVQEQHLGQQHAETAQTLHELAIFYQKQGNWNEALSLAERTRQIRSKILGEAHPKTVATHMLYAQLLQEQALDQQEEAQPSTKEGCGGKGNAVVR